MNLLFAIIVGIGSIFACVLAAALIADPTIITRFFLVIWKLLGQTDSPFFWMLTFPTIIILVLFVLYVAFLRLVTVHKR